MHDELVLSIYALIRTTNAFTFTSHNMNVCLCSKYLHCTLPFLTSGSLTQHHSNCSTSAFSPSCSSSSSSPSTSSSSSSSSSPDLSCFSLSLLSTTRQAVENPVSWAWSMVVGQEGRMERRWCERLKHR